jgi:hypothetical protein
MSQELVPILADAVRAYYDVEELREFCDLFDYDLDWDHARNRPSYLRFARRLIVQKEIGNNRRILESLLPSLFLRCDEMVGKTSWEKKAYHQEMVSRLDQLRPLLDSRGIPSEIAVPDDQPFTAKSQLREFLANAETEVLVIDGYVGLGTLDCLRDVTHPIRLLTGDQKQSVQQGFEAAIKDFRAESRFIEVRRHAKLHDRYLIFNDRCWLVGSSLKDAGKKALNVIECVDSKHAIVVEAEKKWKEGISYM